MECSMMSWLLVINPLFPKGLKAEEEEQGTFLGQFTYDMEGFLIQTFQLKVCRSCWEILINIAVDQGNNYSNPYS